MQTSYEHISGNHYHIYFGWGISLVLLKLLSGVQKQIGTRQTNKL